MNFPRDLFKKQAIKSGHSAKFVKEALKYIDKLNAKDLPVIFSLMHLSILVGIELSELERIIDRRHYFYSHYLIKKKRGGFRRIVAPHANIKYLQKWIKENILDKVILSDYATGFVKNKSILHNAKIHENKDAILNIDLSNFFETISERRVYGIFKSLGYASNLSVDLAKVCTARVNKDIFNSLSEIEQEHFKDLHNLNKSVLVQGAPTSPAISNIICRKMDYRLSKLADSLGANYSRYADDITFSGNISQLPNLGIIKKIVEEEDFCINWNKVGRYKKGQKQAVTGLLIDNNVRIPKSFKKNIYRHLYFCKKFGASSHFQKISPDKGYRKEWILGKILYVNSIEPEEAKKMYKLVQEIEWEI